ncbi:hypothetical protein C8J57DRAFT_1680817 [Mycena rebaudengoi]|nr:hypothetical protein C8J57DRAFT_1680817 [Mycena rebaudengoi]
MPPKPTRWASNIVDPATRCLDVNPDIEGTGVRLAFYLQTFLLVVTAGRSLKDAPIAVLTLIGTSFGLVISAFVAAGLNQLPLHQAIVVTYLIWLANWAIFLALVTYARHPDVSQFIRYFAILQTYLSTACMLYPWIRAPMLEDADKLAGTTIFFLFVSMSAVGTGRIVALTIIALLAAYSVTIFLPLWRQLHPSAPTHPQSSQRQNPLPFDPHLLTLFAYFIVPYVVSIAFTEVQIRRNPLCPDPRALWGVGRLSLLRRQLSQYM